MRKGGKTVEVPIIINPPPITLPPNPIGPGVPNPDDPEIIIPPLPGTCIDIYTPSGDPVVSSTELDNIYNLILPWGTVIALNVGNVINYLITQEFTGIRKCTYTVDSVQVSEEHELPTITKSFNPDPLVTTNALGKVIQVLANVNFSVTVGSGNITIGAFGLTFDPIQVGSQTPLSGWSDTLLPSEYEEKQTGVTPTELGLPTIGQVPLIPIDELIPEQLDSSPITVAQPKARKPITTIKFSDNVLTSVSEIVTQPGFKQLLVADSTSLNWSTKLLSPREMTDLLETFIPFVSTKEQRHELNLLINSIYTDGYQYLYILTSTPSDAAYGSATRQ